MYYIEACTVIPTLPSGCPPGNTVWVDLDAYSQNYYSTAIGNELLATLQSINEFIAFSPDNAQVFFWVAASLTFMGMAIGIIVSLIRKIR